MTPSKAQFLPGLHVELLAPFRGRRVNVREFREELCRWSHLNKPMSWRLLLDARRLGMVDIRRDGWLTFKK